MKLTKNMSELIGAIIGDGNIYNKRPSYVEITGNRKLDSHYFNNVLSNIVKKELDYIPRISEREGAIRFRINNKSFVNWLIDLGIPDGGEKFLNVHIPKQIYNDILLTKLCIRGIFDTDGFIYWDKRQIYANPYPRLGITTCSKRLFNQLVEVLERLEFEGIYKKLYAERGAYDVELYGHANLQKWIALIGSSNKKNLDKIMPL